MVPINLYCSLSSFLCTSHLTTTSTLFFFYTHCSEQGVVLSENLLVKNKKPARCQLATTAPRWQIMYNFYEADTSGLNNGLTKIYEIAGYLPFVIHRKMYNILEKSLLSG